MASRQVKRTGKDKNGNITRLCGDAFTVSEADAITQIENRVHEYYVHVAGVGAVDVVVNSRGLVKYLRTDPDKTKTNNLAELPDC